MSAATGTAVNVRWVAQVGAPGVPGVSAEVGYVTLDVLSGPDGPREEVERVGKRKYRIKRLGRTLVADCAGQRIGVMVAVADGDRPLKKYVATYDPVPPLAEETKRAAWAAVRERAAAEARLASARREP